MIFVEEKKYDLKDEIVEGLCSLGRKYDLEKIILFGSRAKKTNWERSDIDLAVSGFRGAVDFFGFKEDVERIPTLLIFDIVDLESSLISGALRQEIQKYGVILYEKI